MIGDNSCFCFIRNCSVTLGNRKFEICQTFCTTWVKRHACEMRASHSLILKKDNELSEFTNNYKAYI